MMSRAPKGTVEEVRGKQPVRLAGLLDRYAIDCDDQPSRTAFAAHSASLASVCG